jgi:hypothetical protein
MLELRLIIINLLDSENKFNNYFINILGQTKNLIDFFIDAELKDLFKIKIVNEIINKFEQL